MELVTLKLSADCKYESARNQKACLLIESQRLPSAVAAAHRLAAQLSEARNNG